MRRNRGLDEDERILYKSYHTPLSSTSSFKAVPAALTEDLEFITKIIDSADFSLYQLTLRPLRMMSTPSAKLIGSYEYLNV